MEVVKALEAGNAALHQLHELYTLERIEDILEEGEEAKQIEDEIADALAQYGASGQWTEEMENEIQEELIAMERELGLGDATTTTIVHTAVEDQKELDLPQAPTHIPKREEEQEEQEEQEGKVAVMS